LPIRVSELYEKPLPENPFWISGGVLPKSGIMLMGGEAKIMKTWLALDMAYTLTVGGSLWGTEYKVSMPTSVHYFEQEVGEIEFQRRVKLKYDVLGKKPVDEFYVDSRLKGLYVDKSEGQKILAKGIEESKAKIAILDPIGRMLNGDENSNNDVARVFASLDELLITFPELSFVVIHHFGKPSRDPEASGIDPLSPYNFRGASKWFDAPDTLITAVRMADHPGEWRRLKSRITVRQGPPPENDFKLSVLPGGVVIPTPVAPKVPGALKAPTSRPQWGSKRP
jgi:hypothetical protein